MRYHDPRFGGAPDRDRMHAYDPDKAPDAAAWLALDEAERIALVEEYHWLANISLPNVRRHASVHATVETQVARGDQTPVAATLGRLLAEGLARHDAIHAIGSVFAEVLDDTARGLAPPGDPDEAHYARLKQLTAKGWREAF